MNPGRGPVLVVAGSYLTLCFDPCSSPLLPIHSLHSFKAAFLSFVTVMTVSLLVDDQDSQIQYLCPSLHQIVTGSYYNNTWSTVESESCSSGWFQYTFNGALLLEGPYVIFIGLTSLLLRVGVGVQVSASVANAGQNYQVKIDDGSFVPQTGHGSYQSPVLPDGKHTITYASSFSSRTPPSFDYLAVTPGPSTPLSGRTLAVDDADPAFIYSGKWTTTPLNPITFDYSTSLYRNTTHWSSTIGDTLQFNFIGASLKHVFNASEFINHVKYRHIYRCLRHSSQHLIRGKHHCNIHH